MCMHLTMVEERAIWVEGGRDAAIERSSSQSKEIWKDLTSVRAREGDREGGEPNGAWCGAELSGASGENTGGRLPTGCAGPPRLQTVRG